MIGSCKIGFTMETSSTRQGNTSEPEGGRQSPEDLEDDKVVEAEESSTQVEKAGQRNTGESEEPDQNSDNLEGDEVVVPENNVTHRTGNEIIEPCLGMEFDSEEDAKSFYNEYASKVGFVVRMMTRRRSEIDGKTVARRLGCNKQGFTSPPPKVKIGPDRKPRPSARSGCNAAIQFRLMDKSRKWEVTYFLKEHNHPLLVTNHAYANLGDKERKILELTEELHRQDEICADYKQKLISLLDSVENRTEHLSSRALTIAQNMKKAEAEALACKSSR